ncbi:MAG: arginase [Cyclobacteriaceae bacterium]
MNKIDLIGVPSDFGANTKGSRLGPDCLRVASVFEKIKELVTDVKDKGNIDVPTANSIVDQSPEKNRLFEIQKVNEQLKQEVLTSLNNNRLPICLGGDHSLSIGSLAAVSEHHKGKSMGLIWIDTHSDINTPESSPSKNIHGMPISVLLGQGYESLVNLFPKDSPFQPKNIVMLGLRDIDAREKENLKESGVTYYTMRDVDEIGIQKLMNTIKSDVIDHVDGIHVSFDLDVMDPLLVPGVSTPIAGGLTAREAHLCLEMLHETDKIVSADFVELNPYLDNKGTSARIAVELICSLVGKTII